MDTKQLHPDIGTPLYVILARCIGARTRCEETGNSIWFDRWTRQIHFIENELLPTGSGIDSGTKIDLDRSTEERLVLTTSFHHMNDSGYYDGWTNHDVVVRPSLTSGIGIKISGPNRREVKDYLHESYEIALRAPLSADHFSRMHSQGGES